MANKENIAYLSNLQGMATTPDTAKQGNLPVFGPQHALLDSGKKPSDFITQSGVDAAVATATAELWSVVTAESALAAYQAPDWTIGTDYAVGDYAQFDGQGYRCTTAHTSSETFDATKWRLVLTADGKTSISTLLEAYSKDGLAALADLAPSYNGSKYYDIGMLVVKDGVLQICTKADRGPLAEFTRDATVEGALAVRLSQVVAQIPTKVSALENDTGFIKSDDLPYRLVNVSATRTDPEFLEVKLTDRAVNCCAIEVPSGVSIRLVPPERPVSQTSDIVLARDFYVVLNLKSWIDVDVTMQRASMQDCLGQPVTPLKVPANGVAVFRLTDSDLGSQNEVFLVSGFGDAAHRAAQELEHALDDILRDYGGGVFTPGMFLQDDRNPNRYHKLVIVTDDETGLKGIGVDQEGVIK